MTDEELALACADQKVVHLRCDCSHDETDHGAFGCGFCACPLKPFQVARIRRLLKGMTQ